MRSAAARWWGLLPPLPEVTWPWALHSAWGGMALYTASPLRTFEDKLGVQAPVGVCDPSGFTAEGNFEYLASPRQTELQRGRVSLLTSRCYITLEIVVKLPGSCLLQLV